MLNARGWHVDVYERVSDDLATRGAGIGTHDELFTVMRRLGIPVDASIGVEVAERICLDHSGHMLHRVPLPQMMTAWARVYRPLKDLFPQRQYHFGMNVERVEQDAREVTAFFSDGSSACADLLIAADGIRSTVRASVLPEAQPRYAGYVAWRGVVDEKAVSRQTHDAIFDRYFFGLPVGEMMLAYPVPGRYWNYVWYRPTLEAELANLGTGARGPHVRPELAQQLKDIAHAKLAPLLAELVERSEPFYQAIYDLETPRIAAGRVALLGDAAFVARPHVGMGVTKAALDAACLARSLELESGVEAALRRYARLRGEFGRRCVARARRLGAYIEARTRPHLRWPASALDQTPERILREIGAAVADIPELALEI